MASNKSVAIKSPRKLIEVALPLEAINRESVREKEPFTLLRRFHFVDATIKVSLKSRIVDELGEQDCACSSQGPPSPPKMKGTWMTMSN